MRVSFITLLALFTLIAGGCATQPTLPSTTISTLTISGAAPGVGSTAQFVASIVPANGTSSTDVTAVAVWTVSDTTIATVSKGVVTGVKAGSTTLTATYNGSSASQQISIHS